MDHLNKGKAKYILAWLSALLLMLITLYSSAININGTHFHFILTSEPGISPKHQPHNSDPNLPLTVIDTPPVKRIADTAGINALTDTPLVKKPLRDTTLKAVVDTMSFRSSKDSLSSPVVYHADDSMVVDIPAKKMFLYGKLSSIKYEDNDLSAPEIQYDQSHNLVTAFLKKDSAGNVIAYPNFNQGTFKSVSDTIAFNMKTGKGLTKGTYTQQGEMYIYGEKIKKVDQTTFYAYRGRFTTCNLDTPHFAFVANRIKFIQGKMAFTGPVHPEFEGVPLPIVLPFGIYPLSQGRHSGILAPTFTANQQLGLALEGLGYYKILSPTWDIIARGTIYSYGGWTGSVNPRYYKRYRYSGNLSVDMQYFKTNFKGDPDYSSNRTINFRWTHSSDTKARPGVSFSANVNAGSSKFNSQVPNSPTRNFTNQLNSSITYSKVWKDKPYNLSISANHNQNTQLRLINLNLPDISFNVNTLYPFRRKEVVGEFKWYENIGVALNTNARSLSSFYDTAGHIFQQIFDTLQWGASHNIPISLSLPPLGPVQIAPTITYQEKWYQKKTFRQFNPVTKIQDITVKKGFYTAREMNFGLNASTRIFGMYTFKKKSHVMAIRHEIRPSIGFTYHPDFNKGNYYDARYDTTQRTQSYSYYENSIYGPFSKGKFGGLNFGIDNVIQMKTRSRKDTSEAGIKKVSLIDGLGISGSYNFLQDSFKLSALNVTARSNLFNKINITANAAFYPYQTNANGDFINKLVWSQKALTLGTLTNGSVSLQSSFRGGDKTKKPTTPANTLQQMSAVNGVSLDEYQQEAAYISNNPAEFADFSIPWDVSFSYSLRFQRQRKTADIGYETKFYQDVNWNGSVNLTPKWKIGVNGSYNITDKQIGLISMYLTREMHCWQMAINISPVGKYKFFSINISPKSGLLRDLKINRTRYFYDL